jgi:hypothetical protein
MVEEHGAEFAAVSTMADDEGQRHDALVHVYFVTALSLVGWGPVSPATFTTYRWMNLRHSIHTYI